MTRVPVNFRVAFGFKYALFKTLRRRFIVPSFKGIQFNCEIRTVTFKCVPCSVKNIWFINVVLRCSSSGTQLQKKKCWVIIKRARNIVVCCSARCVLSVRHKRGADLCHPKEWKISCKRALDSVIFLGLHFMTQLRSDKSQHEHKLFFIFSFYSTELH